MTKSLYIHIPFCGNICWFCDFKRIKTNEYNIMKEYIHKIIKQLEDESRFLKYETIYLGGGTPNYLPNDLLEELLYSINKFIDFDSKYEFSIECNPEYVTEQQIVLFKKLNINRISLGVQSLNKEILKFMNRNHTNQQVIDVIKLLYKYGIDNVSLDFIYNLPNMSLEDLDHVFNFIIQYDIKHVSFYALEIKENSILNKRQISLNYETEEEHLLYIIKKFHEINFNRYEVSNWCSENKYQSKHNNVYWEFRNWKAIGYGSYGYEGDVYYWYSGKVNHFNKEMQYLSKEEIYQNILMMGLRKIEGIDLNNQLNKEAFEYYKNKLNGYVITSNNKVKAINVDCLNDVLINIF